MYSQTKLAKVKKKNLNVTHPFISKIYFSFLTLVSFVWGNTVSNVVYWVYVEIG